MEGPSTGESDDAKAVVDDVNASPEQQWGQQFARFAARQKDHSATERSRKRRHHRSRQDPGSRHTQGMQRDRSAGHGERQRGARPKPECRYKDACYNHDPAHRERYIHPGPPEGVEGRDGVQHDWGEGQRLGGEGRTEAEVAVLQAQLLEDDGDGLFVEPAAVAEPEPIVDQDGTDMDVSEPVVLVKDSLVTSQSTEAPSQPVEEPADVLHALEAASATVLPPPSVDESDSDDAVSMDDDQPSPVLPMYYNPPPVLPQQAVSADPPSTEGPSAVRQTRLTFTAAGLGYTATRRPLIDAYDPSLALLPFYDPVHWQRIVELLQTPLPDPRSFYSFVRKIHAATTQWYTESAAFEGVPSRWPSQCRLRGLREFIEESLEDGDRDVFFESILPALQSLALQLPTLCQDGLCRLRPLSTAAGTPPFTITLTRMQIACVIVHAFFGTIPLAPDSLQHTLYDDAGASYSIPEYYPSFHFHRLFAGHGDDAQDGKLFCFFRYFSHIAMEKEPLVGDVMLSRRSLTSDAVPDWEASTHTLSPLSIRSNGTIEDDHGSLKIDFANRFIGGGVLGHGAVQEEILFCIYPELLVSRLLTACLNDHECVIMRGAGRFSLYSGYASTFAFAGIYDDPTHVAEDDCLDSDFVGLDAINFREGGRTLLSQYDTVWMLRELNKAYIGFLGWQPPHTPPATALRPIATGRWGCGAFGGDLELKFVLQWMAASLAGRTMQYYTFGDDTYTAQCQSLADQLLEHHVTLDQLWKALQYVRPMKEEGDCSIFAVVSSVCCPPDE